MMPVKIPFVFGLSPQEPPVEPTDDLWQIPLPVLRQDFYPASVRPFRQPTPTYGDYFCAARDFLEQDNAAVLCTAVSQVSGRPIKADDLSKVSVYIVKHGAYYHPGYVTVDAVGQQWPMVLNVAVSPAGQRIITDEYRNLVILNSERPKKFWPMVFGQGTGHTCRQQPLPMFLGQWLEGFYEFHLTQDGTGSKKNVIVWNNDQGHELLPPFQVKELLRKSTAILAYAYNPLTLEGIRGWHHAAGDFVIRPSEKSLQVRLITVRRYAPVLDIATPDVAAILDALLVYFIELSLRMRLDRLNGVGKATRHPLEVLPAICAGLFEGLALSAADRGLPDDFAETAMQYFALQDENQLRSILESITTRSFFPAQERTLVSQMIGPHARRLAEILTQPQDLPQHADERPVPPHYIVGKMR